MAAKLTELTTQYHTFEDNQVLTKDQLNEFINYFEDQDRLTRIFLSGVGIVCGFNLKLNSEKSKITISQGVGVTTDGDLIKLKKNIGQSPLKSIDLAQIEYTHFKKFEDSFAGYRFFKKQVTVDGVKKTIPINLWEILPEAGENTSLLNTLPNLDNKVVLLYLESFAKEGDLCTSIDCDNQGIEQVARLRVLLVTKADAAYIAGLDSIFTKHDVADDYFKLPEVAVRRVVLNGTNASGYDNLKLAYYRALINNDRLLQNLTNGISNVVTNFNPILKLNLTKSSLFSLNSNLQNIFSFSAYTVPFNIQYRYDCVKDIVDTYNEIKCLLLALREECCPNIKAFPKHLMLGCINEINSDVKHYRHRFYKSPILNCETNKIEQCKNLVLRLFEIIGQFKTSVGETKITPSNKLPELSFRSIPFYYSVDLGLLSSWNYFKTEKDKQDTNLCYHTNNLSPALHIQNPLNYNTDKFDFYRIEGHQGKDYQVVLEEIDKLKTEHGLAFDVKALSVNINSRNLNVDDYLCEFEDLNVLLRAWTAEQECVLAEVSGFFSGFSVAVPGENVKEPQLNLSRPIVETAAETNTLETPKSTFFTKATSGTRFITAAAAEAQYEPLTYIKSEVISENLTTSEDALGSVMKVAFEATKGGSVNDIIAMSQTLVAEKVNTDEWNSKPEIKAFVIDQSIELMAHAHILSQKMPTTLTNVSVAQVDAYKATMSNLCALVKKMKASYQKVDLSIGLKAFIGIFINQLSIVCCSGKKLQILLEEINKRKESILVRLQLSKFVEKNPGLEHRAGVQPGGTFILVYLNKVKMQESKENVVTEKLINTDNTFNPRTALTNLKARTTIDVVEESITSASSLRINENIFLNDNFEMFERFIGSTDLPNNTVIADFSLPYMCCSDCALVNFIIAKPPVSLRLEKDEFCLGKDTSPLLFEVSPEDGVIKADPESAGITIDGKKLMLDAALFPDEMLGKPILFTVNDQITQTQLTVYRAVQFDFEVPESPTSVSKVNFRPTGKLDGATFLWSFGDDNLSTERNPTHVYNLPVNEDNKVTVSLTVTAPNGVCHNTVEHQIEFIVEETKISLEKENFCQNDKNSYPFVVTPTGAEVKIEGSGVEPDNLGGFVFIPAIADTGEINFSLNGEPSGVKVMVHEAPVAKFEPNQVENQLVLTNNSTGADSYVWIVNKIEFSAADISSHIISLTSSSPTLWALQLRAISKTCGDSASAIIEFETRFNEQPPVDNCVEETKAAILIDANVLVKLQNPNSDFIQQIWQRTSQLYGGTTEFNKGVLDDIDNYLAGKNNDRLESEFIDLLVTTQNIIVEIDRLKFKEDFDKLIELFGLQLQLFYNILGCQDAATIKQFTGILQDILNRIIGILQFLKEMKVTMPDSLKAFIKAYAEKVKDIGLLVEHLQIISDQILI
ncbi:MAG: PKD domain-containing protein [Bacteroidetes bacterium]|nr:PKD domain-containing protein [Bacteroidota bacterium]